MDRTLLTDAWHLEEEQREAAVESLCEKYLISDLSSTEFILSTL